jgi:hypothetical protein
MEQGEGTASYEGQDPAVGTGADEGLLHVGIPEEASVGLLPQSSPSPRRSLSLSLQPAG